MQISTTSPQASSAEQGGAGIRVTKIAQDQQKAEGQAAVQLIESAAAVAKPNGASSGQAIDVYV